MMIYPDIAAAIMVALFIWLVPVRRNGIPGLRGRGKLPPVPPPAHPGYFTPGLAPPDEMTGEPAGGHGYGQDGRLLAKLDATWKPGYADEVTAQHQSRQKPD